MKKYSIFALTLVLMATLLAGCRNPNLDMDTNPGDTALPTGDTVEPTSEHRPTQPETTPATTLPQTNPTTENPTVGTEDTTEGADLESRFRRRMPGM